MSIALGGTFVADPTHSTVQFEVKHMGVARFRARFADYDIRISDTDGPLTTQGTIVVDSVSITAPKELRQAVVDGEDFFAAATHPNISFRSTDVTVQDDGTAQVSGELTIKGLTKPFTATGTATAPVDDPFGGVRAGVDLVAVVDRRDWGLSWQMPMPKGGDVLGYEVKLDLQLDLIKES
jgi:polyisoprenoid-binding protein YceI